MSELKKPAGYKVTHKNQLYFCIPAIKWGMKFKIQHPL